MREAPVKRTRFRLALLAVIAVIAVAALLPATASAKQIRVGQGKVAVTLDPTYFALFLLAGYPIYPAGPAVMDFSTANAVLTLPVTGGVWHTGSNAHGTFVTKGGITFIHYSSGLESLSFTGWHAIVGAGSEGWTGVGKGDNIGSFGVLFDEDLTNSHTSFTHIHGHKYLEITDVALTYDSDLQSVYASAFSSSAIPDNTPFGTATLLARVK